MKYQEPKTPLLSLFDFDRFPPSIANLPAAITINSTTVYPTFRYNAKDAGATIWNPWGYGQQLTLNTGTNPTYNNGSPLLGSLDDSVLFNGDGYYSDTSGTTFGNIGGNDVVLEIILKIGTDKSIANKSNTNWRLGYSLEITSDNRLFWSKGSSSAQISLSSNALTANSYYHAMMFMDDNGSAQWYINGAVSNSAIDFSSATGNHDNATSFILGANRLGAYQYISNISYLALWQGATWLDSHLQPTVASTRFMQLTGLYPQQARGTALPTAYTRALASYMDKIESDGTTKLYYIGAGWPRVCSRIDSAGKTIKGYLEEGSSINYQNYSAWGNSSIWTKIRTTVSSTPIILPDGTTSITNVLAEDASLNTHYTYYDIPSAIWTIGNGVTKVYSCSFYAKALNRHHVFHTLTEGNTGNTLINIDVDLSNGTFTTSAGAISTYISASSVLTANVISCSNSWYRIILVVSITGGASGTTIYPATYIESTSGEGITGFQGLTQDSIGLWGFSQELGSYPTTYIPTTTTAVTRAADVLTFVANDGNTTVGQGTLVYDILLPSYDTSTDGYAVTISNAGSTTINIKSGVTKTDYSQLVINNTTTQAVVTGTTDISSNTVKTITNTWNTNSAILQVNSTQEGTPSTTCTIPTVTQIDLSDEAGANQINGLISNVKIYGSDNATKNR